MKKTILWVNLVLIIATLTACTQSNQDELSVLKDTILNLEGQVDSLETSKKGLEDEIKRFENANKELESQLSDAQNACQEIGAYVEKVTISPSGRYITFIVHDTRSVDGNAYFVDLESDTTQIIGHNAYSDSINWSSDSNYFVLDWGTFVTRVGEVYSVKNGEFVLDINYRGDIFWLDSDTIVYESDNNDLILNDDIEPPTTTDIVIHNISTGEIIKLYEGTSEYRFRLMNVVDNRIECIKDYESVDMKDEEVSFQY